MGSPTVPGEPGTPPLSSSRCSSWQDLGSSGVLAPHMQYWELSASPQVLPPDRRQSGTFQYLPLPNCNPPL